MMKTFLRLSALLMCLLLLAPLVGAADMVDMYSNVSVPKDAESVDFGDLSIVNMKRLTDNLKQLPNLKEVRMFGSRLSVQQLEELMAEFPGVQFHTNLAVVRGIRRTDATAHSTMNTPDDKRNPTSAFRSLKYLKNLKYLDVGHNAIDDLSFLYDLPELRILIVADNYITDLTPIASLKHLQYLEVFTNNITDLSPLSGLTELLDLNICYNKIRDVTPLFPLKQLERLWLRDVYLTAEQKAELEAALPDTEIVYEWQGPTAHGWRRHPRYKIIRRIYDSQEYIPFSEATP